jgi:protein-arginine kinase activator protein McsA
MKNEITIPILVNDLKEQDLITAEEHRKKYSRMRDLQAEDFNRAIVTRLVKDKEKQELVLNEDIKMVKCDKCGKEFSVEITTKGLKTCPECKSPDGTSELTI